MATSGDSDFGGCICGGPPISNSHTACPSVGPAPLQGPQSSTPPICHFAPLLPLPSRPLSFSPDHWPVSLSFLLPSGHHTPPLPSSQGIFLKASQISPPLLGLCSTLNEIWAPWHICCSSAPPSHTCSAPSGLRASARWSPALSHSWSSQPLSQPHPQPAHMVLPVAGPQTWAGSLLAVLSLPTSSPARS